MGSPKVLTRYVSRAVTVGLIVTIVCGLTFALAAWISGIWGVIIATGASAVLTTGLLSVLYDAFLKDSLAKDIFEALRIEKSISGVQLQSIQEARYVDLRHFLPNKGSVQILPWDPEDWLKSELEILLRAASDHEIQVELYLPNSDSPYLEVLADRYRSLPHELEARLNQASIDIGRSWDREQRRTGSALKVYRYPGVPACGIMLTEETAVMEIGPSQRYQPLERGRWILTFDRKGSAVADWLALQLSVDLDDIYHPVQVDERPLPSPSAKVHPARRQPLRATKGI